MLRQFTTLSIAALLGLLILLNGPPAIAAPPDEGVPASDIQPTIERSVAFLAKEGVAWMKSQQCASCHHLPMMVWALNEAQQHGYPVDEESLAKVTSWALAKKNHALAFQDLPVDKGKTEKDYLGPLLMALAVASRPDRDAATNVERLRLLTHALSQQAADGSWHANNTGRPPIHTSKDIQTSWVLLALGDPPAQLEAADPWKSQRSAAADWLSHNPPGESTQAIAMRLLVFNRLGKNSDDSRPLLESFLRLQNDDGGWSQIPSLKSDAYATGLALYVLSQQNSPDRDAAIARAQAFLVKSQQSNGTWPMVSRPSEPSGPGPAKDLGPITYIAAAWATIGLARSCPGNTVEKK